MRHLLCCAAVLVLVHATAGDDKKPDDTPAAAKTRQLLKKKITVEFKNTRFAEAMDEIKEEVKGLKIVYDAGISRNKMVNYKAKDKTVEQIFDELFKSLGGIGYIVVSKKGDAYDGSVKIRQSEERGYEKK